ncbi:MAG: SBBP repeat-containing protein [Phycisphaeraceae bacterium]|nr:SBBP repeat-containing protein [Phycisphaeraceae bacterium]
MNNLNRIDVGDTARRLIACAVVLCAATVVVELHAETPPPIAWIRQWGTLTDDYGLGVATDAVGNVLIAGYTYGSLGGTSAGGRDAFVNKYDPTGTLAWTRQLGTPKTDHCWGVATDAVGNVFLTGETNGSLDGISAGGWDAFVSKYDTTGNLAWTRQLGASSTDVSYGVATDTAGNVFITGYTSGSLGGTNAGGWDAFVSKYNPAGTFAWTRQLGTSNYDHSYGIATDTAGNLFITGFTDGSLGGTNAGDYDAFVSKYDAAGTLAWTRQIGTSNYDNSIGVSTDTAGNVFITGTTHGSLDGSNAGRSDAYLSKYDTLGNLAWIRQLGTSNYDHSYGIATDAAGNVFITGSMDAGTSDIFVSKYDALGNLAWTQQMEVSGFSRGVATDAAGNLFITGYTGGDLGGPSAGASDPFVIKFTSITNLGDANNDQQINLCDLQILGDNWQANGVNWASGDFTGDGLVNLADLQVLGDNWGYGVGADVAFDEALRLAGLNVPEPAALVLLLAGVGLGVGVRRNSAC